MFSARGRPHEVPPGGSDLDQSYFLVIVLRTTTLIETIIIH